MSRFHHIMLAVAERLLVELNGLFAYTESDEASVLLRPDTELFIESGEARLDFPPGSRARCSRSSRAQKRISTAVCGWAPRKSSDRLLSLAPGRATRCCLNAGVTGRCASRQDRETGNLRLDGLDFRRKRALFSQGHTLQAPGLAEVAPALLDAGGEARHEPKTERPPRLSAEAWPSDGAAARDAYSFSCRTSVQSSPCVRAAVK